VAVEGPGGAGGPQGLRPGQGGQRRGREMPTFEASGMPASLAQVFQGRRGRHCGQPEETCTPWSVFRRLPHTPTG